MKKRNKFLLICFVAALSLSCLFAFAACGKKTAEAPYTPETFAEDRVYELDLINTDIMGQDAVRLVLGALIDTDKTYFEFGKDGKVHGQLVTVPLNMDQLLESIGKLLPNISKANIESMIKNLDLGSGLNTMAEPMFPGFAAHIANGDLEGAMKLVENSLGMNIEGLDYSDPKLAAALKKMGDEYKNSNGKNMHLPSDLLSLIPANTQLAITANWDYNIVRQKGNDGTSHDAIFIGGETAHTAQTQPFAIFSLRTNKDGSETMDMRIEFLNSTISLKLKERK